MAMVSPNYPRISTNFRKPHSHHIGLFIDFKHVSKRSLLNREVFDKRALVRKLVKCRKNVFHIIP
jgi:hypothetical protein